MIGVERERKGDERRWRFGEWRESSFTEGKEEMESPETQRSRVFSKKRIRVSLSKKVYIREEKTEKLEGSSRRRSKGMGGER